MLVLLSYLIFNLTCAGRQEECRDNDQIDAEPGEINAELQLEVHEGGYARQG